MTASPETTDPLLALVQKWRSQAECEGGGDGGAAYSGAADDLRAVMDGFDEQVESTEYRVTVNRPVSGPMTFDVRDFQAQFWLDNGRADGYPPAVVESRTVTTITTRSAWHPVNDTPE